LSQGHNLVQCPYPFLAIPNAETYAVTISIPQGNALHTPCGIRAFDVGIYEVYGIHLFFALEARC
jgi:hypothetical protein